MINKKSLMIAAVASMGLCFSACGDDNDTPDQNQLDSKKTAIITQYVNGVVVPTYKSLADEANELAALCEELRQAPTQGKVQQCCDKWISARKYWELSEAFLFGAAADYNIDPHIDSWPLQKSQLDNILANSALIKALDEDGAGANAIWNITNVTRSDRRYHYTSDTAFRAEKLYNSMEWDRPLSMALATLGILLFIITCRCVAQSRQLPRWSRSGAIVVLVFSLAYLTMALILRWIISGHVPMSNGFETMQFMAWGAVVLTLVAARKSMLVLPFGILTAGLALMVASFGESNPQITQLMPVLVSPLLSIHVAVIMIAYALLAFLMLGGVMALTLRNNKEVVERLHVVGQVILYPAVFLLTIGVFIGAVWANVSWGSYWSWDPKEVWALITLIIYALPLHGQSLPLMRKPMFFHVYCIVAFLSVLITYFGVNFILGGMHSYA